jgi:[methyl-Co(III) methanol-specific corrinoid protein]:coenzyme M methyltransferase
MKLTGCVNNPEVLLKGTRQHVREQVEVIIEKGIKLISPECAIPLKVRN